MPALPGALSALAIACFACTAGLGIYVSTRLPSRLDIWAERLRGSATPLAAFFTLLGRWYAIVAIAAVAAAAAAATSRSLVPVAWLFVSQVLGQGAVSAVKAVARRTRPTAWVLRLEPDSSFPSGHATTAVVFFAGLIVVVGASGAPAPLGLALGAILGVCALGIPWSRLALGAHYATDVLGGLCFGTGWLLLTLEAYRRLTA